MTRKYRKAYYKENDIISSAVFLPKPVIHCNGFAALRAPDNHLSTRFSDLILSAIFLLLTNTASSAQQPDYAVKEWAPGQRCNVEVATRTYKTPEAACRAVIAVDSAGRIVGQWEGTITVYENCEQRSGLSYAGYELVNGWTYPNKFYNPEMRIKCNYNRSDGGSIASSLIRAGTCGDGLIEQRGLCVKDEDDGEKDKCGSVPQAGNPFVISTGEKLFDVDETVRLGAIFDLTRHYRSFSSRDGLVKNTNWKFNFEYGLKYDMIAQQYTLTDPEGQNLKYERSQSNTSDFQLVSGSGGGILRLLPNKNDKIVPVYFTPNGWIVWFAGLNDAGLDIDRILLPGGGELEFSYGTQPGANLQIQAVSLSAKPSLKIKFTHNRTPATIDTIESIQNSQSTEPEYTLKYEYNTSGQLKSVSRFLGRENGSPAYKESYLYEDADFDHLITGFVDSRGVRYATWTYDRSARVVESKHVDSTNTTTIVYDDTNLRRTVTNALGKKAIYSFQKERGGLRLRSVEGIASPSCPASARSISYDSNGRILSTIDEEGRKISYTRDAQGRPLSIVRSNQ